MFFRLLKTKSSKSLILIFVVACLTVSGLVAMNLQIRKAGADLNENYVLVQTQQSLIDAQNEMDQLLTDTAEQRGKLFSLVLNNDDRSVVDFLSQLDSWETELGVQLDTSSLEVAVGGKDKYDSLVVQMNIAGDETQVFNMIKLLENMPYKAEIKNLSITRANSKKGEMTVSLVLAVTMLPKN